MQTVKKNHPSALVGAAEDLASLNEPSMARPNAKEQKATNCMEMSEPEANGLPAPERRAMDTNRDD